MISIIIVNYKTPQLCLDCIESIKKYSSSFQYEIILIENGSGDDSFEILSKKLSSDVILLKSEKNLGFGRANNLAALSAKGDYLFFLNSDTLLLDNSIFYLRDFLKTHHQVACVGAILLNTQKNNVLSYHSFPSMKVSIKVALSKLKRRLMPMSATIGNYYSKDKELKNPIEVDYVMGADLMIRKDAWEESGGFDKHIFMYFEEADLQKRIKSKGWKCMIEPQAHIIHLEGKSVKEDYFKRMVYNTSMMYYFKKYTNTSIFFLFKCLLFMIYSINCCERNFSRKEQKEFLALFNPFIHQDYKS
jgi:GT2 family glycosyltransferase